MSTYGKYVTDYRFTYSDCRVCGSEESTAGPLRVCDDCLERRACRIFGHDMDDADWCTRCHRHVCDMCRSKVDAP